MPRDARVGEEGHLAEVAADVGAADPDGVDADEGLAGPRAVGGRDVDSLPRLRSLEGKGLHPRGCSAGEGTGHPPARRPRRQGYGARIQSGFLLDLPARGVTLYGASDEIGAYVKDDP